MITHRLSRLRRIERQLASRSANVPILLYHRVARVRTDPWSLAVTPGRFGEQLEVLRRHARPIRLDQLSRALVLDRSIPNRSVVVTFDDGYADNLYNAKPLLERHDVPATIFLPSGCIGCTQEFWWDELDRLLLQPGRLPRNLDLNIGGTVYQWRLDEAARYPRADFKRNRHWRAWEDAPSPRHSLYKSLWQLLHTLPGDQQQGVLVELREWAGVERAGRVSHRVLSVEETTDLAEGDLVEIGAHTVTHPSLAALPVESQRNEIRKSKAELEEIGDCPVTSFAYPYGKQPDYSAQTIALVREAGFTCACSNVSGVVKQPAHRFQLPRMQVHDWDGDTFAWYLVRWLDG